MNASNRKTAWRMKQGLVALACLAAATAVEGQTPKTVSALHPVTVTAPAGKPPAEAGEHTGPGQPEPNDAAHQGVKVHGHWAVDVKNPDGSIAKHIEFENSLVTGENGDLLLALIMSGRMVASDWALTLNGSTSSEPALCNAGSQTVCVGVSTLTGLVGQQFCSGTASAACTIGTAVNPAPVGSNFGIVITGNISPTQAGNITSVQTHLSGCATALIAGGVGLTTFSPQSCATSNLQTLNNNFAAESTTFTSTSSFTPIAVAVGQVVAITVTISFS